MIYIFSFKKGAGWENGENGFTKGDVSFPKNEKAALKGDIIFTKRDIIIPLIRSNTLKGELIFPNKRKGVFLRDWLFPVGE